MNEELVPRCIICNEEFGLNEWVARLDATQQLEGLLASVVPGATFAPSPMCSRCKNDPERAERFLEGITQEELLRRIGARIERHLNIEERFEERRD